MRRHQAEHLVAAVGLAGVVVLRVEEVRVALPVVQVEVVVHREEVRRLGADLAVEED